MIHLLNSAMMPRAGHYSMTRITSAQFFQMFLEAMESERLNNCIGYPQNLEMIEEHTGIRLKTSREQTNVLDGDDLLIMKLRYRTDGVKGRSVSPDDFEFFHATYTI